MNSGYAGLSTLLHLAAIIARFVYLWLGVIAPATIGIQMYMASLSIIVLTLFGFWFSALGFGVYGLYVFNHNQVSQTKYCNISTCKKKEREHTIQIVKIDDSSKYVVLIFLLIKSKKEYASKKMNLKIFQPWRSSDGHPQK